MINKDKLKKKVNIKALENATVVEYQVIFNEDLQDDLKLIRTEKIFSTEDNKIEITPEYGGTHVDFYITKGEARVSESKVFMGTLNDNKYAEPYKEYIEFNDKKEIGLNKKECKVIFFNILTSSTSIVSGNEVVADLEFNTYINNSFFYVAVNKCDSPFVYIVQTADTNVPIVIVSKLRRIDLENIVEFIFDGNVIEDTYNSYFHPRKYSVSNTKEYDNVVYGSPAGKIVNKLEFDESIEMEKGIYYISNSDGIKCERGKEDNRQVFLNHHMIAEYEVWQASIKDLELYKYIDKMDLFNSLYEIEYILSFDELISKYKHIIDKFPTFNFISNDGVAVDKTYASPVEKIRTDDGFEVYRFTDYEEDYDDTYPTIVIRVVDEETIEILRYYRPFVDQTNITEYSIISGSYIMSINYSNDIFFHNISKNRNINYSVYGRDIIYRDLFWVNTDNSNNIIGTNLPISGKFTEYNMFGIPKDF